MKICVYSLMIPLFGVLLPVLAEMRVFTDKDGRSIEAELISYDEARSQVKIKPAGSRSSATVPINLLSEKDQQYIRNWATYQEFLGTRMRCDFNRMEEQVASLPTSASTQIYTDHWFKIEFKNRIDTKFENLTLEYVMYYNQEHHTSRGNDVKTQEGAFYKKETITLPARQNTEFETDPVKLYAWNTISLKPVDSEMIGIRVRLTIPSDSEEKVFREFHYPDGLEKAWVSETTDAQVKIKF